ncbi:MAG: WD40 repeat domain-containing protein, partial [Anaerolineales bacterium]
TSGAEGALVMWDLREDSLPRQVLGYSETNAASLAFTPDGQSLAALYGAFDDTIQTFRASEMQIWDLSGSAPVSRTLSVGAITITAQSLAMHPRTGVMAVGLGDGSIAQIELAAGEVVTKSQNIHQNAVTALTYSPDGIWLASGDASGEVIVQNTVTDVRRPLRSHTTEVRGLAFGRFGGAWALASSNESHIALWDVLKGQLIAEFPYQRVEHLVFTPDGETLIAGDADGGISILSVGVEVSKVRACSLSGRNLAWQEWKTYISGSGRPYPVVCSQNPVDYTDLALGALADARTDARLGNWDQARIGLILAVGYAQKVKVGNFELARSMCVEAWPDFENLVQPICDSALELAPGPLEETELYMVTGDIEKAVERLRASSNALGQTGDAARLQEFCLDWLDEPRMAEVVPGTLCRAAVQAVTQVDDVFANQAVCTSFAEVPALKVVGRPACQMAVQLALEQSNAETLNEICGEQSVRRLADIALPACERAIALALAGNAEYPDAFYRETRGLTYGVLGDLQKSLADLEAFVAWAIATDEFLEAVPERERWIEVLRSGRSPFDDETLQAVIGDY